MRSFLIATLIACVAAEQGYNYQRPSVLDYQGGDLPVESGEASSVQPGFLNGGLPAEPQDSVLKVTKRFFTFNAADDNDDDEDAGEGRVQEHRNYDVIFAKAPSSSLKSALKAVKQYTGEQNTAVYVLSKTLGAAELGNALRASGIKPNKPEVHFLKYKTPEEAAYAQQQVRAQYERLGGTTKNAAEETVPVQSVVGNGGPSNNHHHHHQHRPNHQQHQGGYGYRQLSSSSLSNHYLPPRF